MISVIVPVYNIEKYIEKVLESIVGQTYKDFELLVVNDGTKDNSIELAKNYLKDKDINYRIIEKENGGLASARNAGLYNAKGEYISFIDGDDYISKDFLETLHNDMVNNDVDFSFCAFKFVKEQYIDIDNNKSTTLYNKEKLIDAFLKRNISFVVPSMFFKKEFLINNNIHFNEKTLFSEDQMFIWDCIFSCDKAVYNSSKMYGYCVRENSIMTSSSVDKIIDSNHEYETYVKMIKDKYPEYEKQISMILPRWQLGSLYSAARITDKDNFKKLYDLFGGRNILNRIISINEPKAYTLALIAKVSRNLLYYLCRGVNLSG